jgi:ABC-type polysaccharide/polyol phosphate transport system ATPase subunit
VSKEAIISVRNLSKAYNVYERPRDILLEALGGGVRHDVFWALRGVDLDIFEGQRVGIIGANGAGKSTLLKILTGNLSPTAGDVDVRGKISALLSLTSFLNPDQTGLENIRFNLIVNGAPKSDLPRLTEEIIDFTELGAFIKAPVRTYSSGMHTRLAFAISTAITPDILVIDEVLGAGDAYFAAKATVRMLDLCKQGRALLFVSHAMAAVQLLCDTAIWMDNGQIREIGSVEEIGRRYEADFRRQEDEHLRAGNAARRSMLADTVMPAEIGGPDLWRLRLTGEGGRLHDTHYVRRLDVTLAGQRHPVPLDFADIDDPDVQVCLDLSGSEWARVHERHGHRSRTLSPGSSLLRGGHILARTPAEAGEVDAVEVVVESTSLGGTEELALQLADAQSGQWTNLDVVSRDVVADGWTRVVFAGAFTHASPAAHAAYMKRVTDVARPEVEIVDVRMLVQEEVALSVREHEPFALEVEVNAAQRVPIADVWIQLTRSDGVYVFWQSSGQWEDGNLRDLEGTAVVRFEFEPNIFGPGDYELEVATANGFDLELNWPHSQVFDRRIGALKLTVARERKLVLMGPVNHRFPISVRTRDGEQAIGVRDAGSAELGR